MTDFNLVKIDGQEDCLPRIQWDPLVDFLETLIILNFFRVFRELISGKKLSIEDDSICQESSRLLS